MSPPREEALPTRTGLATTFGDVQPLVVPGAARRAATFLGNLLGAVGLVLCVPFVILAVGMPIVLGVKFLLWFAGIL